MGTTSPVRSDPRRRRRAALLALVIAAMAVALGMVVAGCGAALPDTDVATLSPTEGTTPGSNPALSTDPRTAALDYAKCMREHGIDMPDPETDSEGRTKMVIGGPNGPGKAPDKDKMDAAESACRPIMDAAAAEAEKNIDPAEKERMQQQALAFAQCMREHGIDMPDPIFEGGGVKQQLGEPGQGPDPSSPAFKAAQDACGAPDGAVLSTGGAGDGPGLGTSGGNTSGGSAK